MERKKLLPHSLHFTYGSSVPNVGGYVFISMRPVPLQREQGMTVPIDEPDFSLAGVL